MGQKRGTILRCARSDGLRTSTASLDFVPTRGCGEFSVTRRPASCGWCGGGKTACGTCGQISRSFYDRRVRRVRDLSCGDARVYLEFEVRRVGCRSCGTVKQEKLAWLADNPFYTKRFAFYVGRRCRSATVRDVARELKLDWKTVKELEKQYMGKQRRRAPKPAPRVTEAENPFPVWR